MSNTNKEAVGFILAQELAILIVLTVPNCMLKSLWEEGESGDIRKKLKSRSAALSVTDLRS